MHQLTKDADKLICKLYRAYLEKRDSGYAKLDSKHTGSAEDMERDIVSGMIAEDIADTCSELSHAEFLVCQFADNTVVDSYLTDSAIAYMENRFKNGLSSVIDYLAKVFPMLG